MQSSSLPLRATLLLLASTWSRRKFLQAGGLAAASLLTGRTVSAAISGRGAERLALAWVRPRNAADLTALAEFDLTHLARPGGLEVLLWPGDAAQLRATGIPHEITVGDLVGRDRALRVASPSPRSARQPGERGDYRALRDYEKDLHDLASARPDIARVFALPEPSEAGRITYGIEIAEAVRRPDGRPTLYVDGLHHAREWPSGEMAIMFAHDLVAGFGSDAQVTRLLQSLRVIVVPVMNVDGFTYSRTHLYDDNDYGRSYPAAYAGFGAYWRKNRRTLTQDRGLGHLDGLAGYGVDNNRNYAVGFGGPGTSSNPAQTTYRGPSAFSEPETRNVGRVVLSRTVTAALSHHTYANLVLRPWGNTRDDSPDEPLLKSLGDAMAEHNEYTSQKGIDLYPTTGTMSDWAYAAVGALGYTFEHGTDNFHPPYAAFIPENYARNRKPFLMLAEAAADPAHHAVITGRTMRGGSGSEEAVIVRKAVSMATEGGRHDDRLEIAISSQRDGRFEIHLGPSTPPLATSPENYEVVAGRSAVPVVVARGERVDLGRIPVS
ncbi:MAG TPA: M14 family metallopeptidase [Acidimicrobiales bacterium]|nr:M14 family metallopeptidase [Acidimicrobiales bacterium]